MQIKDISKQLNISVAKLVAFLKSKGMQDAAEQSVLSHEQVELLRQEFQSCGSGAGNITGKQVVLEDMTVGELANRLECSANSLIVQLLKRGIIASKNQLLKRVEIASFLQDQGVSFVELEEKPDSVLEKVFEAKSFTGKEIRLPIVAIVGHVDHGKTSLLDYLRKTKVVEQEKGGITQHVSAYEVTTQYGNLVFLDTPGHEAFSLMRERGVLLADLVILIVALDDGVKPQTVESIKKIQELGTTTVVALNKADKAGPDRIEVVKRQLADYGILPDDWGGDVPCVAISAKTGAGIDELLEVLRLQADILDLKTSLTDPAQGFVLETMVERGRGAVATVILHKGTLSVGDYFVCGHTFGKVSSMKNSKGESVQKIGPSTPVVIAGFSSLPEAGDMFEFATFDQVKKHKSEQKKKSTVSVKNQFTPDDDVKVINIIVKTGTHLSKEAVASSLEKLKKDKSVQLKLIDIGIGDINEGNIELAMTTGSIIYGLGVKIHKTVLSRIDKSVDIRVFDIIYKLLEDVQEVLDKNKVKEIIEKQIGIARVKAIFNIKSIGVVAGAAVESGALQKGAKVRVFRGGALVAQGTIKTLQKDRNIVSAVKAGSDCAFMLEEFSDWQIGDEVHCFVESE